MTYIVPQPASLQPGTGMYDWEQSSATFLHPLPGPQAQDSRLVLLSPFKAECSWRLSLSLA